MAGIVTRLPRPSIAPSILTADFGILAEQIRAAERGGAAAIHLDVMDGSFVPNISFGPLVIDAVNEATSLPLDVHLMIENPERYIDAFADAGADIISIHFEATDHPHRVLQQIKSRDVDAGLALNPGTSLGVIDELISFIDVLLIMTVNPGFGGQRFIPSMLSKISRASRMLDDKDCAAVRIEVDGGINTRNIGRTVNAGGDIIVAGSSVYNEQQSVAEAINELKRSLEE
jgi:ribulose-phosphate 3-epimerase